MMLGQAIRYRINIDADGVPNLERSAFGGQIDLNGNSTWQIIARGVEDLQVEYENAAGWQDDAGHDRLRRELHRRHGRPTYDTLIRRVRDPALGAGHGDGRARRGDDERALGATPSGASSRREVAPRPAADRPRHVQRRAVGPVPSAASSPAPGLPPEPFGSPGAGPGAISIGS